MQSYTETKNKNMELEISKLSTFKEAHGKQQIVTGLHKKTGQAKAAISLRHGHRQLKTPLPRSNSCYVYLKFARMAHA